MADEKDNLKIKIGKWFEASATGKFPIGVVAVVIVMIFTSWVIGPW